MQVEHRRDRLRRPPQRRVIHRIRHPLPAQPHLARVAQSTQELGACTCWHGLFPFYKRARVPVRSPSLTYTLPPRSLPWLAEGIPWLIPKSTPFATSSNRSRGPSTSRNAGSASMPWACAMRLPPDVQIQPIVADGVAAEWTTTPQADNTRVIMFLHGGGYMSGSIASHRHMIAEAGRQAGARSFAVGYRLAPEPSLPRRSRRRSPDRLPLSARRRLRPAPHRAGR